MYNETDKYNLIGVLTRIEGKIDGYQNDISQRLDKIEERLTKLENGQSEIKGEVKIIRVFG